MSKRITRKATHTVKMRAVSFWPDWEVVHAIPGAKQVKNIVEVNMRLYGLGDSTLFSRFCTTLERKYHFDMTSLLSVQIERLGEPVAI